MIPISKEEAMYLTSNGVKFGEDGISSTKTKHKKYFLTETKRNKKLLHDFRSKNA